MLQSCCLFSQINDSNKDSIQGIVDIRKLDEVVVIAGRDVGKTGTITSIKKNKAFVTGINIVKKHTKPNPQLGITGGIVEQESPIDIQPNEDGSVDINFDPSVGSQEQGEDHFANLAELLPDSFGPENL